MSGSTAKVSISDESGRRLAEATPWLSDDGLVMALGHVSGGGDLLTYYFGKGRRRVAVHFGDLSGHGRLQTRWQGSRRTWLIRLELAMPAGDAPDPESSARTSNPGRPRAADPGAGQAATLPSGGRP